MTAIKAYAASSKEADLKPFDIERRDVQENDVKIDILHCGVCHSDLHQVRNDWKNSQYPSHCKRHQGYTGRIPMMFSGSSGHKEKFPCNYNRNIRQTQW